MKVLTMPTALPAVADIEKCGLECDVLEVVAQRIFQPYHIPVRPPSCCTFYNTDGQACGR